MEAHRVKRDTSPCWRGMFDRAATTNRVMAIYLCQVFISMVTSQRHKKGKEVSQLLDVRARLQVSCLDQSEPRL